MKYNRFGKNNTYTCEICSKQTRETGHGEESLNLCKSCLYQCYMENAEADYGKDSPQYREALANFEEHRDKQA